METIVYHAAIHPLSGAQGFTPLPNQNRRDNFYLGRDWKYLELPSWIQTPAKSTSLPWAPKASGTIFSIRALSSPPADPGMAANPMQEEEAP